MGRMKKLLTSLLFPLLLILPASAKAARPNFVVFQVDDMTRSQLRADYFDRSGQRKPLFPNIEKYLLQSGTHFADFAASSPICAPSRASLLSGQYAHNNRVLTNSGDMGGALGWMNSPAWGENLTTRLQEAGYHTGHFGKWTNYYGEQTDANIPPGWQTWVTDSTDDSTRDFYGYYQRWKIPRLGIDGSLGPIGDPNYGRGRGLDPQSCRVWMASRRSCNYHTDLMSRMAGDEIRNTQNPFYMQIDYHTPHGDKAPPAGPQVASRHLHLPSRVVLPRRGANFNERDTSDKDYLSQVGNGLLRADNIQIIDSYMRHALVSMKAVDDGIGYVARQLEKKNLLKNTYLLFISDNGLFYGNHRFLFGKMGAYEAASKVPFILRGPGVGRGKISRYPAATVDFAPTVLDLAGARELLSDGESLLPAIQNTALRRTRPRLIEMVSPGEIRQEDGWNRPLPQFPLFPDRPPGKSPNYRYRALQIDQYKYISYDRGGEELYNLAGDPYEMRSLHQDPASSETLLYMREALQKMRSCQGESCLSYSPER